MSCDKFQKAEMLNHLLSFLGDSSLEKYTNQEQMKI